MQEVALKQPELEFKWATQDERIFTCEPVPGWPIRVSRSLGDGTWSFIVRKSGRCNLTSKQSAISLAELDAIQRIEDEIKKGNEIIERYGVNISI